MNGCTKQAQGNFDGMCKAHFKESREELKVVPPLVPLTTPPEPEGPSVYDDILPASMFYVPSGNDVMPLVRHLKEGFDANRTRGWHRQDERRARGLLPVPNSAIQLEGWERELVWLEICILSGSEQASFRHLARAWGRDKGFHMVLAQFICERRGNVERKKRLKGEGKPRQEKRCKSEFQDGEFMEDILDFEDMELPIEMLHVMQQDSDTEDDGVPESEQCADAAESEQFEGAEESHEVEEDHDDYCDPLDEHLLMGNEEDANDHTSPSQGIKKELVDESNQGHEATLVLS